MTRDQIFCQWHPFRFFYTYILHSRELVSVMCSVINFLFFIEVKNGLKENFPFFLKQTSLLKNVENELIQLFLNFLKTGSIGLT